MSEYRILFLGDICGRIGRDAVKEFLPGLQETHDPLFTIVNGENTASGIGITPDIAEELFRHGVDAITLGNHAFKKREVYPYLDSNPCIVRPANLPHGVPGKGHVQISKNGISLVVMNLSGRVYLEGYDDPFACANQILTTLTTPHIFVDFHAEVTSEKVAMGWHLDGRVSAVVGTHTHVQTADERLLLEGTAYITDVGMCGPRDGVIGMDREIILERFRTGMPTKFEVAGGPAVICGVVVSVERSTGRATDIERVRIG